MKSDINRLMADRELDGFIIAGGEEGNIVRDYMLNGATVTHGLVIQKQGSPPIFIASPMELEEAQKSGLTIYTNADLGYYDLTKEYIDDPLKARVIFWERAFQKADIESGKIGVYGTGSINDHLVLIDRLRDELPQYEFVGESGMTLFDEAMLTKDAEEIERIKSVAVRTNDVLEAAWNYIASHHADGETVVDSDGKALTIGDVKRFVRRELQDRELVDEGMIFAQGRDAAFPHSRGEAEMPLKTGQSIVFDLFPGELGGGYHHDVTRTWCIGYAPPEVQQTYDEVLEAFDVAIESFGVGKPTHLMQEAVLDYYEAKGHPTTRTNTKMEKGYVHSLGHGIGLNVHERPSISHLRREDIFEKGNCITIEPGLYYPDKGFGVRVEDLCIVTEDGELVSLTPFRKDLVLPLKG